jgi:hypothetical protein
MSCLTAKVFRQRMSPRSGQGGAAQDEEL